MVAPGTHRPHDGRNLSRYESVWVWDHDYVVTSLYKLYFYPKIVWTQFAMVGSVVPLLTFASLVGIAYCQCNGKDPLSVGRVLTVLSSATSPQICYNTVCNTTDGATGVCKDQCCFVPIGGSCCTPSQNNFL